MPIESTQIHYLCHDLNSKSKVSVYLRDLRNGAVYYARYKIDKQELANGQRFITESLKTDNFDRAIAIAQQRYAQLQFAQESNITLKKITVAEGIRKFLETYEKNVDANIAGWSKSMMNIHRLHLINYWTPFLGLRKLNTINTHDLDGYEAWRQENNKERYKKQLGNLKEHLAKTTINQEIGCFKQCLRWLKDRNLYNGSAYAYKYRVGEKGRRSAFTIEQYRTLFRYMRSSHYAKRATRLDDLRHERYRQMLRA